MKKHKQRRLTDSMIGMLLLLKDVEAMRYGFLCGQDSRDLRALKEQKLVTAEQKDRTLEVRITEQGREWIRCSHRAAAEYSMKARRPQEKYGIFGPNGLRAHHIRHEGA